MRFKVGDSLEEFKRYYASLKDLHDYYRTLGLMDERFGQLGVTEENWVKEDPANLITWRINNETIGHVIWHETSTDEMKKEDPREEEDKKLLRKLLGGKRENLIELHEIWLRKKFRGKGYGKQFFEFFEQFIDQKGYDGIVYYTDNPAAITLCRNRGYKEGFLEKEKWYVFCLQMH
jgi:GNAT superfamily N-acetyltransferase